MTLHLYRRSTRTATPHMRFWRVLALHLHTRLRHRMLALTYSQAARAQPRWRVYRGTWRTLR